MPRSQKFTFQLSIMPKRLAKHISTRVSFKSITRKRHVYIDICWPWIWNQCFYLGIWNDDRTKMIDLPSFNLASRFNPQAQMKLSLLMNSDTLICLWILVFPIGLLEFSTSRKSCFWHYFSSLHDYWSPSTWNSLVHTSWGDMERFEKRAFQLLKMRKMKIRWNLKTKCVTEFLLTVRYSSMKHYTFHYVVIT